MIKLIADSLDDRRTMLLLDYACGALPEGPALLVAAWMALSPEIWRNVRQLESLGGVLMSQGCTPVRMKEDSLRQVLGRLETQERSMQPHPASHSTLPWPLCSYLSCADSAWTPVGRGIRMYDLPVQPHPGHAAVMKLQPNISAPPPRCEQVEMTLVLEGSGNDGNMLYRRGELIIRENACDTRFTAEREGCLSFVVSDGPGPAQKQVSAFSRFLKSLFGR